MNAIYARQSIDKKDSLSIEAQIEQCKKFAGENVRVFKDKGYSGKNINRPDFTKLISEVESGNIKKIFVYRLDRFSRSIADFSRIWELLDKHGVEFYSATENFDTSTPMGRAMLNVVLVFAQLERETTSERVKDNYVHRFRLGAWAGGPPPYGFDLNKITNDGVKASSLVSNEHSSIVKRLFEEYAKPDTSLRSIAKQLTEQGIHGPKREAWDNVTISRILHSPVYVKANNDIYWFFVSKGMNIQHDIEAFDGSHACNVIGRRDRTKNKYNSLDGQMLAVANHEGFIEADLWLAVQEKLEGNPQISRANVGKYSWLTGLMKCEKCGYSIKINHIKKENKCCLVCSGRSNLAICDAAIDVSMTELEEYVAKEIDNMLRNAPPKDMVGNTSKKDAAELIAIEQKISRLVEALSESSKSATPYIIAQIDALDKERENILKDSQKENKPIKQIDFFSLDFEEKKIIASSFIEKILIDGDDVNIVWKI